MIRAAGYLPAGAALLLAAGLAVAAEAPRATSPRIAIIIDDLGYGLRDGLRATRLPAPVACSVLPGAPRAARLAEAAHANGKEVLLHLPMQSTVEDDTDERDTLRIDTGRRAFAALVAAALEQVPHVSGLNNHRGSVLTRHPGHMQWLMEELVAHGDLFFVDSYTTHHSIALQIARENGVPALKRDVFLDASDDPDDIAREFERLKRIARRNGTAVAIGHPRPATLAFLEAALPTLAAEGIDVVPLASLLDAHSGSFAIEPAAAGSL